MQQKVLKTLTLKRFRCALDAYPVAMREERITDPNYYNIRTVYKMNPNLFSVTDRVSTLRRCDTAENLLMQTLQIRTLQKSAGSFTVQYVCISGSN
jgi:hypothetical protein